MLYVVRKAIIGACTNDLPQQIDALGGVFTFIRVIGQSPY